MVFYNQKYTRSTYMLSNRVRSLIVIVCFIIVVSVNYLANALPINGVTQKELSAEYNIYLTPAGYVFAIWGLIYLGLSVYVIVQALPKWIDHSGLRRLDLPFVVSSVCNVIWLIVWHHRLLTVSAVLMLGLLGSLIWAYTQLENNRTSTEATSIWFVDKTFSVYLSWVGLATILNLSIWLESLGWTGTPLTGPVWGVIMLGVACILYLYLSFSHDDGFFLGVLAWASVGIGIRNQAEEVIWATSLIVCAVSLLALVWMVFSTYRANKTMIKPVV